MLAALYEPLAAHEDSPFSGAYTEDREMTFRIKDRHGVRFDQAVLLNGLSGRTSWLWPGRIPFGKVTLIEGPAGAGKSFLALDLVARLTDDRPWPDGTPQPVPGSKAVIVCRQDDACVVVGARLEALGAEPNRFLQFHEFETVSEDGERFGERPVSLPADLPALERLLDRDKSIRLVVVDSLSDFCYGKKALAELVHRLNRLVCDLQVAVVVTLRANCRFDKDGRVAVKSRHDTDGARCNWCCVPDPEDSSRNLFLPTLMNFAAMPTGLAFRLGELKIAWDQEQIDPRKPLRSESECVTWLREMLAEGALPATEVVRLGQECGYSRWQVERASKQLDVKKKRNNKFGKGSKMFWSTGKGPVTDLDELSEKMGHDIDDREIDALGDGIDDEWSPREGDADEQLTDEAALSVASPNEAPGDEKPEEITPASGGWGTNSLNWSAAGGPAPHQPSRQPSPENLQEDDDCDEEEDEVSFPASDAEIAKIVNEKPGGQLEPLEYSL